MKNILLISESTLKTYSNLNDSTFGKWILPAIREAQEMGLMPIIGECLYNKICELVADGSISDELFVAYKDLLDDKIQPYLIYKTLSNIIPILNGKLANIGSTLTNDEHIVNLSQGEADLLKTYYSERCDFYTKRLQDFIKNNASAFPEIACGCGNMQPNLESSENSVGLWLGGSRGKKIGNNKCACSSTGITCADYQSGFTDGQEFQKRKLVITGFTENGRYIREDGYSEVVVNVDTGVTINNQEKSVTITSNTITSITYDEGYTGLESLTLDVDVPQTGHTDEEMQQQYLSGYTNGLEEGYSEGYTSGVTDGFDSGYTSGETHQKSLLSALTITQNGDYEREDGYSAITVNVSGQSATLTTTAVTANGEYAAPQGYDGFSSFEVNVPQTGYTEEQYQEHYSQGYRQGQYFQKTLMTSTAVTENGVYTRSNGFSAVTVNVPQTGISGTQIAVSKDVYLNEFGTYYFIYDSATSLSSMTIHLGETPTAETYYTITYTSHDGNIVMPYSGSSSYGWGATYLYNTYSNGIGNIGFYAKNDNKLIIKPYAFVAQEQLKEMWIPTGTTGIIYYSAFAGSGLEAIHLPNDITKIEHGAFSQSSLKSIELPSSITEIDYDAFWRCSALTSVTINAVNPPAAMPNGPQGWKAFYGSSCPIYVPSQSVNAYKTAEWWSDYADRIQAIQ